MTTQSVKRHLDEFQADVPGYGTILCDLYLLVDLLGGEVNSIDVDWDESSFYCHGCGCEIRLSESQQRAVVVDAEQELRDNWEDHAPLELPSRAVAEAYLASRGG